MTSIQRRIEAPAVSTFQFPSQSGKPIKLPSDIENIVFTFLTPRDITLASRVCRRWRVVFTSDSLWNKIYLKISDRDFYTKLVGIEISKRAVIAISYEVVKIAAGSQLNNNSDQFLRTVLDGISRAIDLAAIEPEYMSKALNLYQKIKDLDSEILEDSEVDPFRIQQYIVNKGYVPLKQFDAALAFIASEKLEETDRDQLLDMVMAGCYKDGNDAKAYEVFALIKDKGFFSKTLEKYKPLDVKHRLKVIRMLPPEFQAQKLWWWILFDLTENPANRPIAHEALKEGYDILSQDKGSSAVKCYMLLGKFAEAETKAEQTNTFEGWVALRTEYLRLGKNSDADRITRKMYDRFKEQMELYMAKQKVLGLP